MFLGKLRALVEKKVTTNKKMRNDLKNGGKSLADPQETAVAILSWLAGEPDIFARFLALSGIDTSVIRQLVNDDGFLAGLVDFVMNHEPDLMAFCAASGKTPEDVVHAWHRLSGPGLDSGVY